MRHKKAYIGVLTLGLLASFSLGASMITLAESEIDESKFTMYKGASVRTEGTTQHPNAQGLRFMTYATEFKSDLQAVYSPYQYNYNWYTQIRFKLYQSTSDDTDVYESYTTDVPTSAWHADGWNTVLLNIPTNAVAVDITAQSFVEVKNKNGATVYETNTEPRTYSAAETASWALAYNMYQNDTQKAFLESYVNAAVSSGELQELNVSRPTFGVEVGGSDDLVADTYPIGYGITYKSNNTSIATVDSNGRVTGVAAGTTTITLSVGSLTKTCTVNVVAKDSVPAAITSWTGTATSWNATQMYPFYYRSSSSTTAAIENGKIKITPRSTASAASACFLELKYDYLDKVFALSKVKAVRIKLTGLSNYRIGNMRIIYDKTSGGALTDEFTRYEQDGDTIWLQFNRGLYEKYLNERKSTTTKFYFRVQFQSATGATSNSIVKPSSYYIEEISPIYDSLTEDFEYGASSYITTDAKSAVEKISERTNGRGMYAMSAAPTADTLTVNIASAYVNKVFASGATTLQFRLYTDKDLKSVTVNGATEGVQYAYNADGEYYVIRVGAAYNGSTLSVAIQAQEALGTVYLDSFTGSDKTLGANVNKSSAYAKDNGGEIEFTAGESFNFYAYSSISDGVLNLGDKKEDYDFADISLESMLELKEAGFNAIMPQGMASVGPNGPRGTYDFKTILDLAEQAGLKVILTDDELAWISAGKNYDETGAQWGAYYRAYTSNRETSGQWAGAAVQGSEMYTYVKKQLAYYIQHPAFMGIVLMDEPPIWMLDESLPNTQEYTKSGMFGFTYKTIKRVAQEAFGKDIFIHANVLPAGQYSTASYGHGEGQRFPELTVKRYGEITGMNVSSYAQNGTTDYVAAAGASFYTALDEYIDTLGSTDAGLTTLMERDVRLEIQRERYGLYCQKFLEVTGASYLMPDIYPMRDGILPSNRHLMEIQTAAEVAAAYGADLHLITQTMKHLVDGKAERPLLENDLRWLNNILLSYGVKNIVYFTYHVHGSDGSTNFDKDSSFVDEMGEKTDVWFSMQQIMAENKAFEKTYQSFDIQSIKTYYKTLAIFDGEYGSAANDIQLNDGSLYVNDTVTFNALMNVKVDGEFTSISEYKNENGGYMYAIMNMLDGKYANDYAAYQTTTLTFSAQYTHVILWRNGEKKLVALDENDSLEIENAAGDVVFVIPYKYIESGEQNDGSFYDPDQEDNGIWFPGNENAGGAW